VIRQALMQDTRQLNRMAIDILRAHQVIFVACGTSRFAALIGRYVFSKIGHTFSDVVMASEFGYFSDSVDKNTLVIASRKAAKPPMSWTALNRLRPRAPPSILLLTSKVHRWPE